MRRNLAGLLAVAALAGGCALPYAETPIPSNFGTTKQQKLQAAAHWNVIAQDVARQLVTGLPQGTRLHVGSVERGTSFDRALRARLTTELVQAGHVVLKTAEPGSLLVELETQAVAFSPNRPKYRHAGTATTLAAGLWALYEVADKTSAAVAGALGIASYDALQWFQSEFASGATPQTEIMVHASLSNASQYLARRTNVYYVADGDRLLYEGGSTKTIQVKGDL